VVEREARPFVCIESMHQELAFLCAVPILRALRGVSGCMTVAASESQARRDVEEAFFLGVLISTGPADTGCSFLSLRSSAWRRRRWVGVALRLLPTSSSTSEVES